MNNIVKSIQWNVKVIFPTCSLQFDLSIFVKGCWNFNEIHFTISKAGRVGLNFDCEDSMGEVGDFS